MNSIVLWVAALAIGTAATVYGAAADAPPMHMALTAVSALGLVGLALIERRRLLASGASEEVLSAATAIAMAVVWAWAALSLLVTYVFISTWGEWWQYVLGAGAVALICFFFSATLARDAAAGREDATMLNLARYLTIGQLAAMIIAMIGLIADGKMSRNPAKPDWAASAIFFFGAAALAAISANALRRTASSRNS
jgi:hypothetical protein